MREVFSKLSARQNHFRFRGTEPGRLENFSDAVFALAVTLLLISTSPPTDFAQMKQFVWELIPFSICITIIIVVWYQHFMFFYRYGLRDATVIAINTSFLVLVLFYVYPLKYLARGILIPISYVFNQEELFQSVVPAFENVVVSDLMIIYGVGYSSLFIILALLYQYARRKAEALELTELERFDTRMGMWTNYLLASVPLISVLLAILLRDSHWCGVVSGFSYFLYPVVMWTFGKIADRERQVLLNVDASSHA